MTRFYDFTLDALSGVQFVVYRDQLSTNGDIESGILAGLDRPRRHDPSKRICDVLGNVLQDQAIQSVVLVRNPMVVLDQNLPGRISKILASLPSDDQWSVIGAGGLGRSERRHLAIYASETPAIPDCSGPHPVLDVMPDIYLVNAEHARNVLLNCQCHADTGLEPILVTEGYLQGRCAIYSPFFTVGIDGPLMARDLLALAREVGDHFGHTLPGQSVQTLSGPVTVPLTAETAMQDPAGNMLSNDTLEDTIRKTIGPLCSPVTLSIVVRTRFDRNHLLQRLLASLSRNDRSGMELEILLSTDVDPLYAQKNLKQLQLDFCNLEIRVQQNQPGIHSRVNNMICGLRAARHDYVMMIDDDDYVDLFALQALSGVRFLDNHPLVIATSEVHEERWEETPSGRWVLTESASRKSYPSTGWRDMFCGANQLPVCALVMPRERLIARLDSFSFNHDLSEDYALFLLVFTDPNLPAIFELAETLCHISLRGQENSVTRQDRRPWVADITAYLADLTSSAGVAGPGTWTLLSRASASEVSIRHCITDLHEALHRSKADVALLRKENDRLRQRKTANEIAK